MPSYSAPVEQVLFLFEDVFNLARYDNLRGFSDLSGGGARAVLSAAALFAEEVLQPLNRIGDRQGCRRETDGSVRVPDGFVEAYRRYAEAGWTGLNAAPEYGGQGLPFVLTTVLNEVNASANLAFSMYPGLSQSAYSAILAHGSAAQRALYLPRLASGQWSGTMNLTEPQCGTDLSLIRTRAAPQPDGTYRLTGQKIFISSGEHDLCENIVHLVLARIEGAPPGTRGLSLFLVPKRLIDAGGSVGERNGLVCGALEHKMGLHGNPTCVIDYDAAVGTLLGEANRGLQAMFVMMNEARIGVATQGLALSEVAYQNAAAYAKSRTQGRRLGKGAPAELQAEPIIVHADVRRMLLNIRAFNEAARALAVWTALQADLAHHAPDAAARQAADDLLGLLTPVLKGVCTDTGLQNCIQAQQVLGGHGYIAEWGMEQFVRDARITTIYEGTNGIQALDLVMRKLPRDGGRAFMSFTAEVSSFCKSLDGLPALEPFVRPLRQGLDRLQQATLWFMKHAREKPDEAAAGSADYMHLFGLVALGYMWARIAAAATRRLEHGSVDHVMTAKLGFGRFFMERTMPETAAHLARITAGSDAVMALPQEAF